MQTSNAQPLAAPQDHVAIREGALRVDGRPTFLFGGELQYFRVRAPDFDGPATWEMWRQTLTLMRRAGMNLVSTYVPWDYHNPAPGRWDFEGARDLGRFLELVAESGMYLLFKPGPLITAEWPGGAGTFGAVPPWWKQAHPEALARRSDGRFFSFAVTGNAAQRQPSYLHPVYLDAVREWYGRALERARPYLGQNLLGIQIDNETNFYWASPFGDLDYSPCALEHYREFLAGRYGDIEALNREYGCSASSFDGVEPPRKGPSILRRDRRANPRLRDWYDACQALAARYLGALKEMIVALGFGPPDLLLFTNDSPFGLNLESLPLRDNLLYDGKVKNAVALDTVDLYPKQMLTNESLQDQPFQADYFTRLYRHYATLATGEPGFVLAAELQAGFWPLPVLGARPTVRAAATDQLLARSVGRGLGGGSLYVIRDGLNADGSRYDYQAPIDHHGRINDRYRVARRWAGLLERHGERLLRSREVTSSVAILQDGAHGAPRQGYLDNMQRLLTIEQPALFGWLACAGFNPVVLDARMVTLDQLRRFSVVLYQNPDVIDEHTAELLYGYCWCGGVLVNFLWPAADNPRMARLFPARPRGYRLWKTPGRAGRLAADFGMQVDGVPSHWYASLWEAEEPARPFLRERRSGHAVGYSVTDQHGTRIFVGSNVYALFNQAAYYRAKESEILEASGLARYLMAHGGETPILTTGAPRQLAWARIAGGAIYLFVLNDNARPARVRVYVRQPGALGLDPGVTYRVTDAFDDSLLTSASGGALAARGLDIQVEGHRSAVALLEPERPGAEARR